MRLLVTSVFALAAGASGCTVGTGKGAVEGSVFIRQCAQRNVGAETGDNFSYGDDGNPIPYAMHPSFFGAEPINDIQRLIPQNRLEIRIQSTGSHINEADVLFINMASDVPVALALGTDIDVGPTTNVRATLSLNQSCPQPEVIPILEGTINFSSFGNSDGVHVSPNFNSEERDRLTATFAFSLVDLRAATLGGVGAVPTEPTVSGNIAGFFDFVVYRGQAAQIHP
ncbi:MAG: hypothetical protein ABI321_20215 [Polyangia bacterium]